MPFGGLLTVGLISAGAGIFGAAESSSASKTAASEQAQSDQNALDFQKQVFAQQQANQQPFLSAGQTSIGNLMTDLGNGTFGAGSLPSVPTAPGAFTGTPPSAFTAPTLAEAQQTPGYQFTAQQGSKGILEGAAAAGGAISGGTLKAMDTYNTGLADTTYNDVFNRSLSTYQAGLSGYNASLQGYQANLSDYASQLAGYQTAQGAQQQEYSQVYNPAALGEGSATAINNTGTAVSQNVGNLMQNIGNAQAAGTVGSANAVSGGVTSAANNITQSMLLSKLLGTPATSAGSSPVNIGSLPMTGSNVYGNIMNTIPG